MSFQNNSSARFLMFHEKMFWFKCVFSYPAVFLVGDLVGDQLICVCAHVFAGGYTCERPWRPDRALGGLLYYSGRSLPEPGLVFSGLDWNPASSGAPPVYTFCKGGVTGVCENPVCFMDPGTQTLVPVIVNQALSLWAISPAHTPFGSSFCDIRCSICPI